MSTTTPRRSPRSFAMIRVPKLLAVPRAVKVIAPSRAEQSTTCTPPGRRRWPVSTYCPRSAVVSRRFRRPTQTRDAATRSQRPPASATPAHPRPPAEQPSPPRPSPGSLGAQGQQFLRAPPRRPTQPAIRATSGRATRPLTSRARSDHPRLDSTRDHEIRLIHFCLYSQYPELRRRPAVAYQPVNDCTIFNSLPSTARGAARRLHHKACDRRLWCSRPLHTLTPWPSASGAGTTTVRGRDTN